MSKRFKSPWPTAVIQVHKLLAVYCAAIARQNLTAKRWAE
jgi:phage gp36-like protein